jgi:hypothetical protein
MSQKSSVPQAISFVSQVLKRDRAQVAKKTAGLVLAVLTIVSRPSSDHKPFRMLLTHRQARCLSMCLRRSGLLMRRS